MLLARLVTGRYGYSAGDEYSRSVAASPVSQGWLTRLLAAISVRKRG